MDDQGTKVKIGIIAFSTTVMLFMFYKIAINGSDALGFGDFLIALLLGSVIGGAAFGVAMMKK
jgi:hypothetical protein